MKKIGITKNIVASIRNNSSVILTILLIFGLSGCATINRVAKDISSDASGGLNRTVTVYSGDGQVLETYSGKIDVRQSEYGNEVKFDLDGKRIIIYNCPVIVEEISQKK